MALPRESHSREIQVENKSVNENKRRDRNSNSRVAWSYSSAPGTARYLRNLNRNLKVFIKILGKSFDCFFFLAISFLLLLSKCFPSRSRSELSCVEEWCQTNANLASRVLALFGILL